jgi:hypothetical protein
MTLLYFYAASPLKLLEAPLDHSLAEKGNDERH